MGLITGLAQWVNDPVLPAFQLSLLLLPTCYAPGTLNHTHLWACMYVSFLQPCTHFPTLLWTNSLIHCNSVEITPPENLFWTHSEKGSIIPFLFSLSREKKKLSYCYNCLFTCLFPLQANSVICGGMSFIFPSLMPRAVTRMLNKWKANWMDEWMDEFPWQNFFVLVWFLVFRSTPTTHGVSQARGLIGAEAAGLYHSHSNARFQPHLWPIAQLTATPDP